MHHALSLSALGVVGRTAVLQRLHIMSLQSALPQCRHALAGAAPAVLLQPEGARSVSSTVDGISQT